MQKLLRLKKKLTGHDHDKYVTTPEFITLATNFFNARLAQANLVAKTDFDNKISSLDSKIAAYKTKNESTEHEIKKLKTFDLSYFIGKSHFKEDSAQNYLVFQPLNKYFKIITNRKYISSWQFKGLSDETIKPPATSDNTLDFFISNLGFCLELGLLRKYVKKEKSTKRSAFTCIKILNQ